MEHVLRQCLIALRLAGLIGLDKEQRAVAYYTALLVNVGCHTDAQEQARWFGDDIALKSTKYDHEYRSLRATATTMRLLGSGRPTLQRFQIGLEFVVSGHRELDGMISHHAHPVLWRPDPTWSAVRTLGREQALWKAEAFNSSARRPSRFQRPAWRASAM